jgi:predicted nucleic acid-binding Zn ribbon protein
MKRGRQRRRARTWEQERLQLGAMELPADGDLVPVNRVLAEVVKGLGIEEDVWQNELLSAWPELVGEDIAKRTRPGRVERGTLVIFVTHSMWLNELARYGKRQILAKLQDRFGAQRVRFIRLQLDPGA